MSDIAGVGNSTVVPGRMVGAPVSIDRTAEARRAHAPERPSDRVELSDRARLLAKLQDPPVRHDLVARVRSEIAAGAYETPERIEAAARAIGEDLELRI